MSDDGTPTGAQGQPDAAGTDPPPIQPGGPWQTGTRVEQLANWIESLRFAFTEAAMERSAVAGGFTADEFRQALVLTETRQRQQQAIGPVRSKARQIVVAAYGLVWILFAIPYVFRSAYGSGVILQAILTVALIIGLAISLLVMRAVHPDPARVGRALTILLVVPVIVLLGISGLCLPFVPSAMAV